MKWDKVSFVLKSESRKRIIALLSSPRTPKQLSKSLKSSLPNISLKLKDLANEGLIKCVNPKEVKGRIYILTEEGKKVLKKVGEMEKD